MIATRFWLGIVGLALAFAMLVGQLAVSMHDRLGMRMVSEGLAADSRVVSWYLRNAAREDASQLIRFAANDAVARALAGASRASDPSDIDGATRRQLKSTLSKIAAEMQRADAFDAVFAVAQSGEVIAFIGFDQAAGSPEFELGGYPVVADALHGYVRDDTLQLDRLYRVVARPVEFEVGQLPAGAIVGARVIDDGFAATLAERTGAAVAFYAGGRRQAAGLPPGLQLDGLDQIVSDLPSLAGDADYADKGRSGVHELADGMAVIYARLPGEAWQLGAGYVVARQGYEVGGLRGVLSQADSKDKEAIQTLLLIGVAVGAIGIGLLLSIWEYNGPLNAYRRQVKSLSTGAGARFAAEKLRAPFRQLGLDLNLALDRVARAGGDGAPISIGFEQMFGEAGSQPSMSAFGVPPSVPPASPGLGEAAKPAPVNAAFASAGGGAPPRRPPRNAQQPVAAAASAGGGPDTPLFAAPAGGTVMGLGQFPSIPPVMPSLEPGYGLPQAGAAQPMASLEDGHHGGHINGHGHGHDEVEPEWTQVYQDFVRIKQDCGEAVEGFTFERFTQTLRKNRDTLMREHGVQQVQFSAYVKQGRAALKAKPVR